MKEVPAALVGLALLASMSCLQEPASRRTVPVTTASAAALGHFENGRALLDDLRFGEATAELSQALALDPAFAQALALRGLATPGPAGLQDLELAHERSVTLSPAERMLIDALLVDRRGDADALEVWQRLAQLAPEDWRAQAGYGRHQMLAREYAGAVESFQRAAQLNRDQTTLFFDLGRAYLRLGDTTGAVDALRRYASLSPDDPAAHDALAESFMAAGRFAEAEDAFRKAASLSPRFWRGWQGIAYTKFFTGDWNSGRDALQRAREAASRWDDVLAIDELLAWEAFVTGDRAEAFRRFDAIERTPEAQAADVATAMVRRAVVLVDSGDYQRALTEVTRAIALAQRTGPANARGRVIRQQGLRVRAVAEAGRGDAVAASATAAALEQDASPDDPVGQSSVHLARGMAALTRHDLVGARGQLTQCSREDWYCRWQLVLVCERAGDRVAADLARQGVLRLFVRDPMYLYVRSKLQS